MPYQSVDGWVARTGGSPEFNPTIMGVSPHDLQGRGDLDFLSQRLRQAFAFFRVNGDRRYAAQSLMRLLRFADIIDNCRESGTTPGTEDIPCVTVAEMPYEYDDETEVKSGGVVGIAVVLPDGRTMLAVHRNKRRAHVGSALIEFNRAYFGYPPMVWVHRENPTGMQFAIARGMRPFDINRQGAVLFAAQPPQALECEAVSEESDEMVDALQRQHNRGRRRPQGRRPSFVLDEVAPLRDEDLSFLRRAGTVTIDPPALDECEWDIEPDYDDSEY